MADMLQLRGLVAAGVDPIRPKAIQATQAAGRSAAIAGAPAAPPAARETRQADSVELRTEVQVPRELARIQLRQETLVRAEARVNALGMLEQRLDAVVRGERDALSALAAGAENLRGLAEPGPRLAQLLLAVEPAAAEGVDPGLVQAAAEVVRNPRLAARGGVGAERAALSTDLVAAENAAAWRVEAERMERGAEMIRRGEAEGQPISLLEALRGPAISRNRVMELLDR
jgi:hypothetical protein